MGGEARTRKLRVTIVMKLKHMIPVAIALALWPTAFAQSPACQAVSAPDARPFTIAIDAAHPAHTVRMPDYPYRAARAGEEGDCRILARVDSRGAVTAVELRECTSPTFTRPALRLARTLAFEPGASDVDVRIRWRLDAVCTPAGSPVLASQ